MLAAMLASMAKMSDESVTMSEMRIQETREQLQKQLQQFLDKLKEALEAAKRAAEQAKDDDGGLFGDVVDVVASAAGTVLGTVVDFVKDVVEAPVEMIEGVVKNIGDPSAWMDTFKSQMVQIATNGDTADSVRGFTKGVVRVAVKLAECATKYALALAEHGFDPKAAWESMKSEAKELWGSFNKNIVQNPDFWQVAGLIAKAASVAAAAMSGGALAWVAIGVFALCEAENRYGFVEHVVGEKAAPWVRMGMNVAAAALLGGAAAAGNGATLARLVQAGGAVVGGAAEIARGVRELEEAQRKADAMEKQADVQEAINRLNQIERLMDDLLDLVEEQHDNRTKFFDLANGVVQAKAAMNSAVLVRA
jgi:hypothetical protein